MQVLGHAGVRTLLWATAFTLAGLLGRATIIEGATLSLVWPAAGVAVLWLLFQQAAPRSWDTVALALATVVVNAVTGASAELVATLVVANLVQALIIVGLLRRWVGHLDGCGGDEPLAANRDLGRFTAACAIGTLAGAVVGTLGATLAEGAWDAVGLIGALVWWGRNLCGAILIGTTGVLTWHRLRSGGTTRPPTRWHVVEGAGLVAATVFLYWIAFGLDLPLAFPLLAIAVWAGLRFSPLAVAWHALGCAALGIGFTLEGDGPFAALDHPALAALLAQLFVGLVALTGLVVAVGRDERVRLADGLRAAERRATAQTDTLTTILESMTDGVAVVDEGGHFVLHNPAALALLGLSGPVPLRQLAQRITRLDGTPFLDEAERPGVRALDAVVRDVDVLVRRPDGTERVLRISGGPLPGESEGSTRAVLNLHDITADLQRAEELQQFARTVAHDIRNPIAAIDGWNAVMRRASRAGTLTPEQVERFTGRLAGSAQRLNRLIDGLLDHATSADRTLALTRIELEPLLRRIVESRGADGHVTWGDLPTVRADTLLVSQLLDNLVGNALKYVEPGAEPRVEVAAEERRPGWATITVRDEGIGIPEAQLESVFDEFQRAHATQFEGTGLGLSIARRVVNRHGGTIRALANDDGRGTTFELTLPLDTTDPPGVATGVRGTNAREHDR
ncbi:ATP-binding protein [Nocardioides taihuensis]|uniref:Sensor-like histidine kinase SenX3 n=1 Tax=Nocardioides taihuensis TaxID=1835606 RepID=A0ABW0BQS7_9ACTN